MKIKYRFEVDGRSRTPVRETWEEAVQDAINAGMCQYYGCGEARMNEGAEIVTIVGSP